MEAITYSLIENSDSSDKFYADLAVFTDEVLAETENLTHNIVKDYIAYRKKNDKDRQYSKQEHGFELLVLGTLWTVYSGDSNNLSEVPKHLLTSLVRLRNQGGSLKPGIDFIRGILSTFFLSPDLYDNEYLLDASLAHLDKLLDWLSATGEFSQEVIRLRDWERYLQSLGPEEAENILATAITLAAWFKVRSDEALGGYTSNVDRYLNELRPEKYWKEDVIFCGRRRVEYHLNMVGAEIMNRAFRERFLNTAHKAVLIPSCMRILTAEKCKGWDDTDGFHCACCTKGCTICKLISIGKQYGFDVKVVSHSTSISANRGSYTVFDCSTGIVGVACVLNLISGGWILDSMGVPAQCVFLDYCGCKNHWSREGIPTQINIGQLMRVLGID